MSMNHGVSRASALILMCCALLAGCSKQETTKAQPVSMGTVALCTDCGQIAGSDACCQPGAVQCAKCGLAKGSPGCCQIAKGSKEPVALCTKCGQIAGSDACCEPGQAMCVKCGLMKGSPGCCKIN